MGGESNSLSDMYKILIHNKEASHELYIDFARKQSGDLPNHEYKDLTSVINNVADEEHRDVLHTMKKFNEAIVRTNFYKKEKSAIAFRLDPSK